MSPHLKFVARQVSAVDPNVIERTCHDHRPVTSGTQVQGKVNAITLDSCSRTGLVFRDLVSSCEVVNCSSVEVQSTGVMPTIAIDKTDGIVVCSLLTLV